MSVAADAPRDRSLLGRLFGVVFSFVMGTLLCLSAATSLLVLGWLMRRMRMVALRSAGVGVERPGWIMGAAGSRGLARWLGGLAANVREGVMAAAALALATAPFSVIWLLSWWAGWENSFSKGYEQAFVGPALGLFGVAVFCGLMIWLPIALAHQAVENRAFALFEFRSIRSAVRHSGWGYVLLALVTVIAALPLFAGRALVVFAGEIVPGFEDMTPDQIEALRSGIALALSAYVFVSLLFLRDWAARLYASAVARALEGPDAALWDRSVLSDGRRAGVRSWKLTHWVRTSMLLVIWFGLAAQVFVGQFLNHDWHLWLTHPLVLLPWAG